MSTWTVVAIAFASFCAGGATMFFITIKLNAITEWADKLQRDLSPSFARNDALLRSLYSAGGYEEEVASGPISAKIVTTICLPSASHFRRRQISHRYRPRDLSDIRRRVVF